MDLPNRPLSLFDLGSSLLTPSFSGEEHLRRPTTQLKGLNPVSWTTEFIAFLEVMTVAVVVDALADNDRQLVFSFIYLVISKTFLNATSKNVVLKINDPALSFVLFFSFFFLAFLLSSVFFFLSFFFSQLALCDDFRFLFLPTYHYYFLLQPLLNKFICVHPSIHDLFHACTLCITSSF